jgi:phosphoenolpyruvate carboxylase
MSASELHRAVMLVMANRLEATIARTADIMYADASELLDE